MKKLKTVNHNILNISFIYLFTIIIFSFLSYSFIIMDYEKLEKDKNLKNIEMFLKSINEELSRVSILAKDYSKWDETYEFIQGGDNNFIYENFREGTNTLEDLNINFMYFVNSSNNLVYSIYNKNNNIKINRKNLEKFLINSFKDKKEFDSLISFEKNVLFISKKEIKNSDQTSNSRGTLYAGRFLTEEKLNDINREIKHISISSINNTNTNLYMTFSHIPTIRINTMLSYNNILSTIEIGSIYKPIYLEAINDISILKNGRSTIWGYNFLISLIILFIFIGFYLSQIKLLKNNRNLEIQVKRRTKDLNKSLRIVKKKNKELFEISNTDYLTQVRNRRNFFYESTELLNKAIENNYHFSVLMIDIDHFKAINDQYGHDIGDKVLVSFCNIVNNIIKKEHIFGRIGGEEFCISFCGLNDKEIIEISEEIRKTCFKSNFSFENINLQFTISLGLSHRKGSETIDEILHIADELLYKAKKSGRNKLIRSKRNKSSDSLLNNISK